MELKELPEYASETQRIVCEAKLARGYEFIGMGKVKLQGDKLFPHLLHSYKQSWSGKTVHSHIAIDENGYDVHMKNL